MNDTTAATGGTASAESLIPDGVATITTIHFVLIGLVALAAIAVIIIGMRLKRRRTHAARQVEENAQDAGMTVRAPDSVPLNEAARTQPKAAPTPAPAPSPAPTPVPPPAAPPVMPAPAVPEEPVAAPEPLSDEPVAAAAPMTASPAAEAAPAAASAEHPEDQPITLLKGLGPKLTQKLAEHGITTVGDMAALSDQQAQALDAQLGPFSGRMARDRWLEQARLLAAGDRVGFEAVFGRL